MKQDGPCWVVVFPYLPALSPLRVSGLVVAALPCWSGTLELMILGMGPMELPSAPAMAPEKDGKPIENPWKINGK